MSGALRRNLGALVGAFGLSLTTGVLAIPGHNAVSVVSAAAPTSPIDVTKVPHYFGPYSNWANSEQAVADAIITIADSPTGVANNATATASVLPNNAVTGGIGAITVTKTGSGYAPAPAIPPSVVITKVSSPAPVIPAQAHAVISTGVISSIAVGNPGFGLTTPSVAISAAPSGGVNAFATASGGVDNVTVAQSSTPNTGGIYASQPSVLFTPPPAGGVQATGTATVTGTVPDLVVTGVTITNPGFGYATAPGITFTTPSGTPDAVAAATTIDVNGSVNSVFTTPVAIVQSTVTNTGGFYASPPQIRFSDSQAGAAFNATGTANSTLLANGSWMVNSVTVTSAGSGYTSAPVITFTSTGTINALAKAPTLDLVTTGAVQMPQDVFMDPTSTPNTGGIYASAPTAFFTAPPTGGVQATGNVTVSGTAPNLVVTGVTITNPGRGYTTAPVITFTPGILDAVAAVTTIDTFGAVNRVINNVAIVPGAILNTGGIYAVQPLAVFTPSPAGLSATATGIATFTGTAPNLVVTGVTVTNAGSGYTTAPGVTIWDGKVGTSAPTPAVAVATIGVNQITLTGTTNVGGSGYSTLTPPVVTITDSVSPFDKGATATATVANAGAVTSIIVDTPGAGYLTPGIKKFVDTLGQFGSAVDPLNPTPYNRIPIAVADTTSFPGTDYYEIGLVQYRQSFSSSLPNPTLLRGYVQLSTSVVPGLNVALTNANLDPTKPASDALLPNPITGLPDPTRVAHGVTPPAYLGPTIVAQKNRPVRITFRNLLPNDQAGDLFLPVDTSLMGSGMGPDAVTLDPFTNIPMDMAVNNNSVLDEVRNPRCGRTPKPTTCFSENRATLHLHGGVTPWISDGTPHQWITPAGENTAYPKGVSVSNVPDMPDPGPGAETFFYTNQQSARLMFYHDHAWGITRLNVYAGEAAGYLVTDDTEKALIGTGGALDGLGTGTPLIIQDKTFVSKTVASGNTDPALGAVTTDPTWNSAKWGGEGNLWTPHVYMPAQNPDSPSGMSAYGRWMYGPWFWPPAKDVKYPPIANPYYLPVVDPLGGQTCDPNQVIDVTTGELKFCEPSLIPSTPNVSVGMEAFNDTPMVNGTVYPTTNVAPQVYRYRILNASNDRFWNLSWYVADPRTGTLSEVALNPAELAAAQLDPVVAPTPDTNFSPAGPDWIQIGTEGGFLPAPVVVPAQPVTYITDPTRFDVGNVDKHSLLLAPAERADVVVDFSQFKGKTLILYNDAPAAFPARVPGYDYYTGDPDMSPVGAPTTLPGYGPNTRTIMQVKVSSTGTPVAFNLPALNAAFAHHLDANLKPAGVFESGSDPIIVGQAAYNSAYFTQASTGVTPTPNQFVAAGWCNSPTSPTASCDGYARVQEQGAVPGAPDTFKFKFDTVGTNTAAGKGPQLAIPFEPKGMHDEMNSASFDEWGRMTANMGLEAPGATPLLQNIILYPFVNPATETLDSTLPGMSNSVNVTPISVATDGTQIWKITHNGVDTHPIHFHLYDVQLLNRVTWDNIIIPPEPSELGWKDTVRVSPLEDTIVALRPIVPVLPFAVPDSKRPLNPALPLHAKGDVNSALGTEAGFNNTDVAGNPMPVAISNEIADFGWEYVWHCHILSHEEMDMMRPVTVHVARALPAASTLTRTGADLSWNDQTPVDWGPAAGPPGIGGSPAGWIAWSGLGTAEIGYRVERAVGTTGSFTTLTNGTLPANSTSLLGAAPASTMTMRYRVTTWNAAGAQSSPEITVPGTLPVQTATTMTTSRNPSNYGQSVTFTATVKRIGGGANPTGFVQFMVDGVPTGAASPLAGGKATFPTTAITAGSHTVVAVYNGIATIAGSESAALTQTVNKGSAVMLVTAAPASPTAFGTTVTFTFQVTPVAAAGAGSMVRFSVDGVLSGGTVMLNPLTGLATLVVPALAIGTHRISVAYSGSANYLAGTVSRTHRVN